MAVVQGDEPLVNSYQDRDSSALSPERVTFVQRVYGLLTASLCLATVGGLVGESMSVAAVWPLSIAGFVLLLVAMACRKVPVLNVCLLFGFAFLEGLGAGPTINMLGKHNYGHIVTEALGITFLTFGSLTAYVFWSKKDFSYLGGFLMTAILGMILFSLVGWFIPMGQTVNLAYCYFGVLLFIGYILYDTSNVIRNYPPDEYVAATIALFLDILNLFWFILRILMNGERSSNRD